MAKFDPTEYMTKVSGKPYLQVNARVLWFRNDHPQGRIVTEAAQFEPFPVMRASIFNNDGVLLATGYGSAQLAGKTVYSGREIEKAETAAIGRALAVAGYGTMSALDDDQDGQLADAPAEPRSAPPPAPKPAKAAADKPKPTGLTPLKPDELGGIFVADTLVLGTSANGKRYVKLVDAATDQYGIMFTAEALRNLGDNWKDWINGLGSDEKIYLPKAMNASLHVETNSDGKIASVKIAGK